MDNNELLRKCFNKFKSMPFNEYISFFELVSSIIGVEEAKCLEKENYMFKLFKAFDKEIKTAKIRTQLRYMQDANVGLPYNIKFCKVDTSKEIRSVTLNYFHGSWGLTDELKRKYVVFSINKIKYVTKPLFKSIRKNPTIEITIEPHYERDEFYLEPHETLDYAKDFGEICSLVKTFIEGEERYCDACPATVVVTYQNGHKDTFYNLSEENSFSLLYDLADKYEPDILKNKKDLMDE